MEGGIKNFPQPATTVGFDLVASVGPFLYIFLFQLTFPVILGGIVYEKEKKLREIMKMVSFPRH
jgi:hypothetical protein